MRKSKPRKNSRSAYRVYAAVLLLSAGPAMASVPKIPLHTVNRSTLKEVPFSQSITISGRIVNAQGETLPGVSVNLKGNPGVGVSSNNNGEDQLNVPNKESVLIFSM